MFSFPCFSSWKKLLFVFFRVVFFGENFLKKVFPIPLSKTSVSWVLRRLECLRHKLLFSIACARKFSQGWVCFRPFRQLVNCLGDVLCVVRLVLPIAVRYHHPARSIGEDYVRTVCCSKISRWLKPVRHISRRGDLRSPVFVFRNILWRATTGRPYGKYDGRDSITA